jgi:SAM-dependent methyltransferase
LQEKEIYEERSRYCRSPPRYLEVISKSSIKDIFHEKFSEWKEKGNEISYLDLGSGECEGTRIFSDFLNTNSGLSIKAVGIDVSTSCESKCREIGIDFIKLDLGSTKIPFKNCQVITMFETIEHILNTDFLLKSIRDAISDDGLLLITTLNVVCWKNRILVPLGIQPVNTEVSLKHLKYGFRLSILKNWVEKWEPAGHIRPFTLYSLCDIISDSGFKVVKSYGLENWRAFKFLEVVSKNMCSGMLVVAKPA